MAPKRSRSDVSEDSVSRKRGRSARRRGSTTMTSAYVNGTSGGGNTGNTCHGRRRGRPRGAGRGRTLNDRCSAASTVTSGSAFGFSHQDSSSDSDTGPMSHRLESTDSDAGSTSDLDEPANTNEMKPDEELANNEPTITDKLMSAVNGALPALRGELAAHARSVLAARAHPLANMLRTLARFTTTVIPNRKRLGLSKSKGTMVKKRAINKCTMKEADINSPELSYLWTPSLNQRFPKSDETLVSTMSGFDGPSTSKFNPMFKDLTPTSPTYKNSRIPDPTNVAQSPTSPIYEDPISDSNIDPKRQNESPTTPTKKDLTEPTNRNPPIHETTRKSTSLSNRDPRLQKNRPATIINIDLTQTTREPSEGEMKLDLKLLSNEDPRLQKKSLTTPINIDLTQTSWDLKPQMNLTTPQQKYYDLTQMDQSPKNEDPMSQSNCESKPNITEEISLQNSNSSLNMNRVKQDGDVKQNGDIKPSVNEDPSLMDWDPTLDLTLDDDDEDVDTMLRKINKITSFHERTLLNDTQDLDLFPEISLPKKTNAFDILMKTEPSGSRRRGSSCGSVRPRSAARAPRAPRERPEDWDPMTEDPLSQSESLSATRSMPRFSGVSLMSGDGEQDEGDVEMGVAETYADYTPAKLNFGLGHPDPVVETASLSSVETADITYQLSLPDETIRSGLLSALQLEAVVYASQAHEQLLADGTRAGFLIGDGAGVGKGRTIAGIIFENYLKGRKRAVWVSVSNDLKYDAERDLRDIGAGNTIKVHPLNKMKYCSISSGVNGSVSEGVVFSTYSSLIGYTTAADAEFNSRLKQLLAWCTPDFDGCIVFDECHRAKNLCPVTAAKPSKTGRAVLNLQQALPKARLVYASATGASEPKNMAYMVRLGIWGEGTPFPTFQDFLRAVEKRGVGAMEIVAMDMKLRGMYIARQLSFHGVTFKIEEVPLSDAFRDTYDKAVALWVDAMELFQEATDMVKPDHKWRKVMWAQFWGAHQRFFKYLCIAAKVSRTVECAQEAVRAGKCVVIGLQSTGEARTLEYLGRSQEQLTDFICTAKGVFESLVEKQFPDPKIMKPEDFLEGRPTAYVRDLVQDIKKGLLEKIAKLGKSLPSNTLDQLVDQLGGPDNVAEMTGRKGRVVQTEDGQILYESRSEADVPLETLNLTEKQRFMDGDKNIAIISEAASSGISLQSDRRVKNHKRRVHITLELPWSADRAIQQFGRTHRSNQVNAPEYIFLISDLAGERRFASTVAKRLESLGALTHGDRRATETRDLSQFNIENKYGRMALKSVRGAVRGEPPLVAPPADYAGVFLSDASAALAAVRLNLDTELDANKVDIQRFMNRLLGVPVALQNALFLYFSDTFEAIVQREKRKGQFDLGILDLGSAGECVRRVKCVRFLCRHATGRAPVELHTVYSERGLTWEKAERMYKELKEPDEGFYLSRGRWKNNYNAMLCVCANNTSRDRNKRMFNVYRPNVGLQVKQESFFDISNKYEAASPQAAGAPWRLQHEKSLTVCTHAYWHGHCSVPGCEVGLRVRKYHVMSGSVLAAWAQLETVLRALRLHNRMQVVRVKTSDGLKIVGTLLPECCVGPLIEELKNEAISFTDETFK